MVGLIKQVITPTLNHLRWDFQRFGLLHQYYKTTKCVDNDFYLRLGTIHTKLTAAKIAAIENDIRNKLQTDLIVSVILDRDNIAFAKYQNLCLTPETTEVLPLVQATEEQVRELY